MPLAAASFAACGALPNLMASKMLFEMACLPTAFGAWIRAVSGAFNDVKITTSQSVIQLLIAG
jgi:hypothetical protein